jgi:putative SOS response-associated peptidase YedK
VSSASPERIAAYFDADADVESLGQNYNVAPTQDVYAVVERPAGSGRTVEAFHWGLIPSWAKDRKIGARMINARSETVREKPAFKGLVAKKRCLVPMDGFYEWRAGSADGPLNAKGQPLKQPMFIHPASGDDLLAAAGLWSAWKDPSDPEQRWLQSLTIVTTHANALMSTVHDRMPVFVPPDRWGEWLDPSNQDVDSLASLFTARNDDLLAMHPVSTDVNNARNNRAELLQPI